eukprot:Skav227737  [mRNA]  locus=scaffold3513:135245:136901:+ [translate_table: standard]
MEDDEEVTATLEAQLVVLGVWPSDTWEDEEFACAENNVRVLEKMLKKPQSPDTSDIDGWPALHTAAAAGHEDCVSETQLENVLLLLEACADQDKAAREDSSAPLHWAAGHGHTGVARLLLEAGAQKDHGAADSGWTPLHSAVLGVHLEP